MAGFDLGIAAQDAAGQNAFGIRRQTLAAALYTGDANADGDELTHCRTDKPCGV